MLAAIYWFAVASLPAAVSCLAALRTRAPGWLALPAGLAIGAFFLFHLALAGQADTDAAPVFVFALGVAAIQGVIAAAVVWALRR